MYVATRALLGELLNSSPMRARVATYAILFYKQLSIFLDWKLLLKTAEYFPSEIVLNTYLNSVSVCQASCLPGNVSHTRIILIVS